MPRKTDKTCRLKEGLVHKLDPCRLDVSSQFHAILACLLDQEWTTPKLTALCVLRDGHVLGEKEGDAGFNYFLCDEAELERNIRGVCRVVGATPEETGYLFNVLARFRA